MLVDRGEIGIERGAAREEDGGRRAKQGVHWRSRHFVGQQDRPRDWCPRVSPLDSAAAERLACHQDGRVVDRALATNLGSSLGIDEALLDGAVIVEWPERTGAEWFSGRISLEIGSASERLIRLQLRPGLAGGA